MNNKNEKENNEELKPKIDEQIDELLLQSRRLFLSEAIDNKSAQALIRKLWYLDLKDPTLPILLVINSPGGSVDAGFAIWDQIKMLRAPITTLVTGLAASMGSVLSLVAPKGRRFATPNARFMIHQPLIGGFIEGQATDLEIQAQEILKTRKTLVQLYSEATGKEQKVVEKAIDRDTWMNPEEAKNFGLIDNIVRSFDDLVKQKLVAG